MGTSLLTACALVSSRRPEDVVWVRSDSFSHFHEFRHVESAFPKLEFRHKRLALPDTFPKLHLCYARVLPSLHKQFYYSPVKIGTK